MITDGGDVGLGYICFIGDAPFGHHKHAVGTSSETVLILNARTSSAASRRIFRPDSQNRVRPQLSGAASRKSKVRSPIFSVTLILAAQALRSGSSGR